MVRNLLVRFFMVTFLFVIIGPTGQARATDTDIVTVSPALWQVKNGPSEIYLLGSFHLLPGNYRWYDGLIARSFDRADELILETDIKPENMAEIQGIMVKNAFFGPEDNLQNNLDDGHYRKLLDRAASLPGMNEAMVNRSKPWFIALRLSIAAIVASGLDPDSGVDKYLQDRARQEGKTVSGLETPREQMMALIDHPLPVQLAMLTDTLDKLDDFKSYITSYLEAWASGDSKRMAKVMVEDMAENQAMYQALLVNRNRNWLPVIEGCLNRPGIKFIVVGAAHLVGPDGIVRMLRDKGYKVDKIQ